MSLLMNTRQFALLGGIGVILVAGLAFAFRSSREAQQLRKQIQELTTNPQRASEEEVKKLVEQVGKLIALPEGEQPTVATVSDREKLKELPFFLHAENGDKVLIYVNARKAFLFRPSSQKLIEVASVNLATGATQEQAFAPKIVLRNGTDITGLTKRLEARVKEAVPGAIIVAKDNAKRTDIAESLIVDLTGSRNADAERLAQLLGMRVGTLPEGESAPKDAEFLILLGKNAGENAGTSLVSPTPAATPSPSASPSPS